MVMAVQFLVGGVVSVFNIMIHALVTVATVGIVAEIAPDGRDGCMRWF
jgi:hypothetical protein